MSPLATHRAERAKPEDDPLAGQLRAAARAADRFGALIRSEDRRHTPRLDHPLGPGGSALAYVCGPAACAPPTADPAALRTLIEHWQR